MPIHSILRCQNTLYTSHMDVGSSLKPVVASTLTLQRHILLDTPCFKGLPPKPQNSTPDLHRRITVRVDPYAHIHSILRYQKALYTSNMDVGSSLKPVVASTITLQHHTGSGLPSKPKTPPPTCREAHPCKGGPICPYTAY
jgi:hypothetical protein